MSRAASIARFGRTQGTALYNRFNSMKTKAKHAEIPFTFESFEAFYETILLQAPQQYTPETHRLGFNLKATNEDGTLKGYCPSTLRIKQTGGRREAQPIQATANLTLHGLKTTVQPVQKPVQPPDLDFQVRLAIELTTRLLTGEYDDLDELCTDALSAAK